MSDPTSGRSTNRIERQVDVPLPVRETDRPAPTTDDRSIMDLIRSLADDSSTLIREEVNLAKTEMQEKLSVFQKNLAKVAVGAAFLLAAVLFIGWAVNMGLTALLAAVVDTSVAIWLAPLLLGVVLALVGWSLAKGGTNEIKEEGVVPEKTVQTLRDDTNWAKRQVRND